MADFASTSGVNTNTTTETRGGQFAGGTDGSMTELFLGYNWRSGRVVAGVQVEGTLFSDLGLKAAGTRTATTSSTTNGVADPTTLDIRPDADNQQLRSMVGLIGRVGFLATPDLLLYGLGGVEFGHFAYATGRTGIGGNNGKWVPGYTAAPAPNCGSPTTGRCAVSIAICISMSTAPRTLPPTGLIPSPVSRPYPPPTRPRQTAADFHIGKIGVVYSSAAAVPPPRWRRCRRRSLRPGRMAGQDPISALYVGAGAGVARGDFASDNPQLGRYLYAERRTRRHHDGNADRPVRGLQSPQRQVRGRRAG